MGRWWGDGYNLENTSPTCFSLSEKYNTYMSSKFITHLFIMWISFYSNLYFSWSCLPRSFHWSWCRSVLNFKQEEQLRSDLTAIREYGFPFHLHLSWYYMIYDLRICMVSTVLVCMQVLPWMIDWTMFQKPLQWGNSNSLKEGLLWIITSNG